MPKNKPKISHQNTPAPKIIEFLGLQFFVLVIVMFFILIPMRPDIIFGKTVDRNPRIVRYASGRGGSYAVYIDSDNQELSNLAQKYGSSLSYQNFAYFAKGNPKTDNVKYEIKRSLLAFAPSNRNVDYGAVQSTMGYVNFVGICITLYVFLFFLSTLSIVMQRFGSVKIRMYLANSKFVSVVILTYIVYIFILLLLSQILIGVLRLPF